MDLTVRIPRWETATSPVGVFDVHVRAQGAPANGPFSPADCASRPDRVAVSFFVANERDQPVGEDGRLQVADGIVHLSGARLSDPTDTTQSISVGQLQLESGGESFPLSGEILEVRFHPTSTSPARMVLLHDHGREAGERDSADERIAALSELVLEALCQPEPALGCLMPGDTRLSLYRLGSGAAIPMVQRSRRVEALDGALDDLRHAGESGSAPYFYLADGVRPGGILLGLAECDGSDSSSQCWPALVLTAGAENLEDSSLDSSSLPQGTRLFAAGLVDRPDLRRLACQTGGFFFSSSRPSELRLIVNRSTTEIPEFDYGFARQVLMALKGRWEATLSLSGLPANYDPSVSSVLSGSLSITLDNQTSSTDFQVTLGGY